MWEKCKKGIESIDKRNLLIFLIWPVFINFLIETLGRRHILGGFISIFNNPVTFLYNVLVIMTTLSVAVFFKRRYFAMSLISVVWLGFGVANFVLLSYRTTPFTAVDLFLIDAALGVMKNYVTTGNLIVVFLIVIVGAVSIFYIWKKAPVLKRFKPLSGIITVGALSLLLAFSTEAGTATGVLATKFGNIADAYKEYGFAYCFTNSLFNTGIKKPADYTEEKVTNIVTASEDKLSQKESNDALKEVVENPEPNVIFLQLESFFDITAVEDLELSEDPIPFYRELMQNYSSGYLNVPSVGAGTANTEFEIITGMDLDFFGPGEYPYKTVLKNTTCESVCYDMKENGYTAHAIHNNRASFYNRHQVFQKFGFDTFTSMELMNIQEYTPNGWAKDKILTEEILKAMQSTEGKDLIYTISVQGHGSYPTEPYNVEEPIKVLGGVKDESKKVAIQYYVNQIKEMDDFLRELVQALEESGEQCILVAYGDHLPGFGFTEEELANENIYQTQYFVWNNIGLSKVDGDLEAYQLTSNIMERIGITSGVLNKFHQTNKDSETYLDDLKMLQYDMLYGNKDVYGGAEGYQETQLVFGVEDIVISNVFRDQSDRDQIIISGENFNKYSHVFVNDVELEAELINPNTLKVEYTDIKDGDIFIVKQSYKGKWFLRESNTFEFSNANEGEYVDDGMNYNDGDFQDSNSDIGAEIEEEAGNTKKNTNN